MKSAICIFLTLFLTISFVKGQSGFQIIKSDPESIWIKLQVDQPVKEKHLWNGQEIFSIMVKDGVRNLEKGTPDLPYMYTSLEIPQGSYEVEIISSKSETISPIIIAPSKGNLLRNIDPESVPFEFGDAYFKSEFPQEKANFGKAFVFGNLRGQTLKVMPFSYIPDSQELTWFSEMILKVTKKETGNENVVLSSNNLINQSFHNIYSRKFLNYSEAKDRYVLVPDLGNLLVIAPSYLHAALEDLIVWRRQMGISSSIVAMEDIGLTGEDLKAFVDNYYATEGLTFLLLVGDIDQIPTLPTGSNNACDHCFSYQSGDDHFPEFFTGRIPASEEADIARIVEKILIYEKTPNLDNIDWFSTGLGMGSNQGPGDDGEYDFEHLNNIKSELLNYGYSSIFEFYDGDQSQNSPTIGDISADLPGNPGSASIRELINSGTSLLNYTGHGAHQVLASGSLDVGDINMLVNDRAYPFAIAVACCVGDFKDDFGDGDCFGEAWMKASNDDGSPTGGIGGCFSTILQSWSPPMEGQDEMNKLITESTENQIRHTIGSIVVHGCSSMIEAYGGGGDNMMDSWSIFGDPSVVLRTAFPNTIAATHQPAIPLGSTSLTISSETENALVGLYYKDSLIGSGIIDGGLASIEFSALNSPDTILVTLTGYNKLPYQGIVEVIANNGPFIVLDNYLIDDSEGNGNFAADYGELIHLDVSLENVGGLEANLVSATLSTNHPAIEVTNSEAIWGTINQEESKMLSAAYSFQIDDLIEDKTILPFVLTITDENENNWSANLNIVANAPKVGITKVELDDTETGNGNHRMDAGEIVQIRITQNNTGHAMTGNEGGQLNSLNPYLQIQNPVSEIGVLLNDGSEVSAVFNVLVKSDVPHGEEAIFTYVITDGLYGAETSFSYPMNLIIEDFESEDFEQFNWTKVWEEDINWFITDLTPFEGSYCAQSGAIDKNQTTTLRMDIDVINAGEISFAYRTESEDNYDFLEFYINDVLKGSWSGNQEWHEVSYPVPPGELRLEWKYVKDGLINAYSDAVWVDNIRLPEHNAIISGTVGSGAQTGLNLFPNPVSNELFIETPGITLHTDEIILSDLQGRRLWNINNTDINGSLVRINLGSLNPGVYVISVFMEDHWEIRKIIVQH